MKSVECEECKVKRSCLQSFKKIDILLTKTKIGSIKPIIFKKLNKNKKSFETIFKTHNNTYLGLKKELYKLIKKYEKILPKDIKFFYNKIKSIFPYISQKTVTRYIIIIGKEKTIILKLETHKSTKKYFINAII